MLEIRHNSVVDTLSLMGHSVDTLVPPNPHTLESQRVKWAKIILTIDPEIALLADMPSDKSFIRVIPAKEAEHRRSVALDAIATILHKEPASCYLGLQYGSIPNISKLLSDHGIPEDRAFNLHLHRDANNRAYGPVLPYAIAEKVRQSSYVIIDQNTLISAAHLATLTEEISCVKRGTPYDTQFVSDFYRQLSHQDAIGSYVALVEKMKEAGVVPAVYVYQNKSFPMSLANRILSDQITNQTTQWTRYTEALYRYYVSIDPTEPLAGEGMDIEISVPELIPFMDREMLSDPVIAGLFSHSEHIRLRIGHTIAGIVSVTMPREQFVSWVAEHVSSDLCRRTSFE